MAADLGNVTLAAQAHGDIKFTLQDFQSPGDTRLATST
jgi:hypothetical protein